MSGARYDSAYFGPHAALARRSAEEIVPLVMEAVHPRSVCDVGCGRGTWLDVFKQHGVATVRGIDGDYVPREMLEIEEHEFLPADLELGVPAAGSFDLALSLEVAEHLPAEASVAFVESLTSLAPVVLFSAAVPGQGGRGHVNEQWPEYWQALFARHDFLAIDSIRPRIWQSPQIRVWYRQNTLLFAARDLVESNQSLKDAHERFGGLPLSVVHPGLLGVALARPWELWQELGAKVESGEITREERDRRMARMLQRFAGPAPMKRGRGR